MEKLCAKKIIFLHVFIESWLKGSIHKNKNEFQYFEDELDQDFIIIHPSGKIQYKQEIINGFYKAYGSRKNEFKIEIKNIKTRFISEHICILNYEEWQSGEEKSGRISTVVFRKSIKSDKYYWFHLHENWM